MSNTEISSTKTNRRTGNTIPTIFIEIIGLNLKKYL